MTASLTSGSVQAALSVTNLSSRGRFSGSWSSRSISGFQVTGLSSGSATVVDAADSVVGIGSASLSSGTPVAVAVSGDVAYAVNGQRELSFYAPGSSGLGASGNWDNYSATVSDNVSITLTVPTAP